MWSRTRRSACGSLATWDCPFAHVETTTVGDRRVIVIERYDRIVHTDGSVERIHQEDFCQATGILPDKKYEEDGGPSLRRMAETLQAVADPNSLELLLRAVTLNVLIGNGDAHGKNFSPCTTPRVCSGRHPCMISSQRWCTATTV